MTAVQLCYTTMSVSAEQQIESVIHIQLLCHYSELETGAKDKVLTLWIFFHFLKHLTCLIMLAKKWVLFLEHLQ